MPVVHWSRQLYNKDQSQYSQHDTQHATPLHSSTNIIKYTVPRLMRSVASQLDAGIVLPNLVKWDCKDAGSCGEQDTMFPVK